MLRTFLFEAILIKFLTMPKSGVNTLIHTGLQDRATSNGIDHNDDRMPKVGMKFFFF